MTKKLIIAFLVAASGQAFAQDDDAKMLERVQNLLHAHQADVFTCVQKEKTPPKGELLVRVFVGEDGARVGRAEVLKNQTGSSTIGTCIDDHIRGWDISSLGAREGDQLVFPLAFKPEGAPGVKLEEKKLDRELTLPDETLVYVVGKKVAVGGEVLQANDAAWVPAGTKLQPRERAATVVLVTGQGGPLGGHPLTVRHASAKTFAIRGGEATLYLDGTGEPLALERLHTDKGAGIPLHKHDSSDELVYVISGKGTTTVDGKPIFTGAGTVLRIPAGVEHSVRVDEPLDAVQIYAPGGPEQRFKNVNGGSRK